MSFTFEKWHATIRGLQRENDARAGFLPAALKKDVTSGA
jgi:hypothetical protein